MAVQNRQELVVPVSFPKLRDSAYITTWCRKQTEICSKNFWKMHFKIRHKTICRQWRTRKLL